MAERVDFVVDQGEDWSAQVIWVSDTLSPMNIKPPIRMDVVNEVGGVVKSLTIDPSAPPPEPGDIPEVSYSEEIGLIQLHLDEAVTRVLAPGTYRYDMFVSVEDGDEYAGDQVVRLIEGFFTVQRAYTKGF